MHLNARTQAQCTQGTNAHTMHVIFAMDKMQTVENQNSQKENVMSYE